VSRARGRVALAASVAFALGVAAWQAELHWSARNPPPPATLEIGETATVAGTTFRLDSLEVAPRLPAADPEQQWVEAPEGAVLVQAVLTTEIVDDGVDPETHYCFATAVDDDGRIWRTDDLGYQVAGPEALTCSGTSEEPIRPGEELTVGFVFLVPGAVAEEIAVDLDLSTYDTVLRLTR
jgi:hypothetical protein